MNVLAYVRCRLRGRHQPVRHPLGGFKCKDCGAAGADLEEMGYGPGYVARERRQYVRVSLWGGMGQVGRS